MSTTTLSFANTTNLLEFIALTNVHIIKMEKLQVIARLKECELELACNAFDAKIISIA